MFFCGTSFCLPVTFVDRKQQLTNSLWNGYRLDLDLFWFRIGLVLERLRIGHAIRKAEDEWFPSLPTLIPNQPVRLIRLLPIEEFFYLCYHLDEKHLAVFSVGLRQIFINFFPSSSAPKLPHWKLRSFSSLRTDFVYPRDDKTDHVGWSKPRFVQLLGTSGTLEIGGLPRTPVFDDTNTNIPRCPSGSISDVSDSHQLTSPSKLDSSVLNITRDCPLDSDGSRWRDGFDTAIASVSTEQLERKKVLFPLNEITQCSTDDQYTFCSADDPRLDQKADSASVYATTSQTSTTDLGLTSTMTSSPQQKQWSESPNVLLIEQLITLLSSTQLCRNVSVTNQNHPCSGRSVAANLNLVIRFLVYFWWKSRNWIVRDGLRFGATYSVYEGNPDYQHSKYCILVSDDAPSSFQNRAQMDPTLSWRAVSGSVRLLGAANKELIVVIPGRDLASGEYCLEELLSSEIPEIIGSKVPDRRLVEEESAGMCRPPATSSSGQSGPKLETLLQFKMTKIQLTDTQEES